MNTFNLPSFKARRKIIQLIMECTKCKDVDIVFFGLNGFNNAQKEKFMQSWGISSFNHIKSVTVNGGIEIQEYLNHHKAESICVVSNQEDVRPFEKYRIDPSSSFLWYKIKKMFRKSYINHMKRQNSFSSRKQF